MVKRILFINSFEFDYLEDLTFAGLTKLLGPDNVVSYPTNYHYYFSKYHYPKNIGQCRKTMDYFRDRLALKKRIQQFEFDAVVIGSTKEDTFISYLMLEPSLPKGIPIIYIDGGDWPEIGGDAKREGFVQYRDVLFRRRTVDVIFKREYVTDFKYESNVHQLSFSFKPTEYEKNGSEKKYDVVFWAVESDQMRTNAFNLIKDKYDCRKNGSVAGQTFKSYRRHGKFFLNELSASKIAYNFRGGGWDTLRYWEVPGVGSLMITPHPRLKIPNNFRNKQNAVFCKNDLTDLIDLTDYYLSHDNEREEIARNGMKHVEQFHTYTKRAQYFLDICNESLSRN